MTSRGNHVPSLAMVTLTLTFASSLAVSSGGVHACVINAFDD